MKRLKVVDADRRRWKAIPAFLCLMAVLLPGHCVWAQAPCSPLEEQPVKIEAWMSKRYEKQFRAIRREFRAMGYTHVALWAYPAENPSRVAAVGRCVPAYIARHALELALKYYGRVDHLVNQNFIYAHWVGLGTSLFAENSLRAITPEQLQQLLDPELDTIQFHALYEKLTVQEKEVPAFGLRLPNPKLMQ